MKSKRIQLNFKNRIDRDRESRSRNQGMMRIRIATSMITRITIPAITINWRKFPFGQT